MKLLPLTPAARRLAAVPLDHDIVLISAFLAGEMDGEEMLAVERRLASDPVFRHKVEPLIKIWNMPVHMAGTFGEPLPFYDTRAEYWQAQLGRMWNGIVRAARWIASKRPAVMEALTTPYSPVLAVVLVAVLISNLELVGRPLMWMTMNRVEYTRYRAQETHRGWTGGMSHPRVIETGENEFRRVDFPDGSWVLVQPNTRFTYPDPTRTKTRRLEQVAIDGEADLYIATDAGVIVETWAGPVIAQRGTYGIRALLVGGITQVTIQSGSITNGRDPSAGGSFHATAGDFVEIAPVGQATRLSSAIGYPIIPKW